MQKWLPVADSPRRPEWMKVLPSSYLGVIKELRGKPQVDAESAIRDARASLVRHQEGEAAAR